MATRGGFSSVMPCRPYDRRWGIANRLPAKRDLADIDGNLLLVDPGSLGDWEVDHALPTLMAAEGGHPQVGNAGTRRVAEHLGDDGPGRGPAVHRQSRGSQIDVPVVEHREDVLAGAMVQDAEDLRLVHDRALFAGGFEIVDAVLMASEEPLAGGWQSGAPSAGTSCFAGPGRRAKLC